MVDRNVEYIETLSTADKITIRKLPEVDFLSRDRQIAGGPLPVWFSLTSSAGFLDRTEPEFQTTTS